MKLEKISQVEKTDDRGRGTTIAIIVVLLFVLGGIAFISTSLIESLSDNSKKMRTYKVVSRVSEEKPIELHDASQQLAKAQVKNGKAEELLSQARQLYIYGKRKEALACYEKSAALINKEIGNQLPNQLDADRLCKCYEPMAQCYFELAQYQNALTYANLSTKLCDHHEQPYVIRVQVYNSMHKPALAKAEEQSLENLSKNKLNMHDLVKDMANYGQDGH